MLLRRLRSIRTKCDLKKKSACVMIILRESRYAFVIRYWFEDFYFELFHGIFLLFHIHIHLTLLCPLILI